MNAAIPTPSNVRCPRCRKIGDWFAGKFGPFCSHRCRLLDLGLWFNEEHRVSEPLRPEHFAGYDALPRARSWMCRKNNFAAQLSSARCARPMSMKTFLTNLTVAAVLLVGTAAKSFSQTNTMNADTQTNSLATATFGGGCFWCTEAMYQTVKGVKSVVSGYAGGARSNPTYEQVCTGVSGHAEVIQITFDPREVSYAQLVDIFWDAHDPTTLNAQGADHGTQYRSTIMFHDEAQRVAAESSKQKAQAKFHKPIVTEIVPLKNFFTAERYHQNYFRDNPNQPYCEAVIRPKLEKFEAKHK